jgi:hypothetical protein
MQHSINAALMLSTKIRHSQFQEGGEEAAPPVMYLKLL